MENKGSWRRKYSTWGSKIMTRILENAIAQTIQEKKKWSQIQCLLERLLVVSFCLLQLIYEASPQLYNTHSCNNYLFQLYSNSHKLLCYCCTKPLRIGNHLLALIPSLPEIQVVCLYMTSNPHGETLIIVATAMDKSHRRAHLGGSETPTLGMKLEIHFQYVYQI